MKKSKRKGFALAEVLLAFILLTGYIIFNTSLYYNAFQNVKEVQQNTIATNLLIKTAEEIKAKEYSEVVSIDEYEQEVSSYKYGIEVAVEQEEYNGIGYKVSTITVSWNENDAMSVKVLSYMDILSWTPPVES